MVITYQQFRQIKGVGEKIDKWIHDHDDRRMLDDLVKDEFGIVFENDDGEIDFKTKHEYTLFLLKWS